MSTHTRPEDTDPTPTPGGTRARPWNPEVPDGCRKCHRRDMPHYARGLCRPCYSWLANGHAIRFFPPLGDERSVYGNHARMRAAAWDRQRRIRQTDGALIPPAACRIEETRIPPPQLPPYGDLVVWSWERETAQAA